MIIPWEVFVSWGLMFLFALILLTVFAIWLKFITLLLFSDSTKDRHNDPSN